MKAHTISPRDPLLNLGLGIAYLRRAMQRVSENRHNLIVHVPSISFLLILKAFYFFFNYYDMQAYKQEAHFNIARAYHQIGLTHQAIPFYEAVLHWNKDVRKNLLLFIEQSAGYTMLEGNAAHNLSLIYLSAGSPILAKSLLVKYCTV